MKWNDDREKFERVAQRFSNNSPPEKVIVICKRPQGWTRLFDKKSWRQRTILGLVIPRVDQANTGELQHSNQIVIDHPL